MRSQCGNHMYHHSGEGGGRPSVSRQDEDDCNIVSISLRAIDADGKADYATLKMKVPSTDDAYETVVQRLAEKLPADSVLTVHPTAGHGDEDCFAEGRRKYCGCSCGCGGYCRGRCGCKRTWRKHRYTTQTVEETGKTREQQILIGGGYINGGTTVYQKIMSHTHDISFIQDCVCTDEKVDELEVQQAGESSMSTHDSSQHRHRSQEHSAAQQRRSASAAVRGGHRREARTNERSHQRRSKSTIQGESRKRSQKTHAKVGKEEGVSGSRKQSQPEKRRSQKQSKMIQEEIIETAESSYTYDTDEPHEDDSYTVDEEKERKEEYASGRLKVRDDERLTRKGRAFEDKRHDVSSTAYGSDNTRTPSGVSYEQHSVSETHTAGGGRVHRQLHQQQQQPEQIHQQHYQQQQQQQQQHHQQQQLQQLHEQQLQHRQHHEQQHEQIHRQVHQQPQQVQQTRESLEGRQHLAQQGSGRHVEYFTDVNHQPRLVVVPPSSHSSSSSSQSPRTMGSVRQRDAFSVASTDQRIKSSRGHSRPQSHRSPASYPRASSSGYLADSFANVGQLQECKEQVTVVEVPEHIEVIREVPKTVVQYVEKRVPKYEVQQKEKIVEVPTIETIERVEEYDQVQEKIVHVAKKIVVDVPREVVRYVPKIETRTVEKIVEVPEVVEVKVPQIIEKHVPVVTYNDIEVPLVVAQVVQPILVQDESKETQEICTEYEPDVIPVDIFVPKPVAIKAEKGSVETEHSVVKLPPSQWNAMLDLLNPHVEHKSELLPYMLDEFGSIKKVSGQVVVRPLPDAIIRGLSSHEAQQRQIQERQLHLHQTQERQLRQSRQEQERQLHLSQERHLHLSQEQQQSRQLRQEQERHEQERLLREAQERLLEQERQMLEIRERGSVTARTATVTSRIGRSRTTSRRSQTASRDPSRGYSRGVSHARSISLGVSERRQKPQRRSCCASATPRAQPTDCNSRSHSSALSAFYVGPPPCYLSCCETREY